MNHHDKRVAYYRERNTHAWSRGFCVGFITACIIVALFLYGQREAHAATRPAPRAAMSEGFPPHWRTWLRIGMCEQPKRGISWHDVNTDRERLQSIAWTQTYNHSFPGGLGLTRDNWRVFRPASARRIDTMDRASIAQQLWAAERLYRWAERTYPGAGQTAWDCHRIIGWYGFNEDGSWR